MKFIHISDIHLGKRVNEFSMLEEQEAILGQILGIIDAEAPDGVLIAGDIYDKPVPPAEAVGLFDGFLASLKERRLHVFIISGNHDSPERIAFGSRIMDGAGIHLSPVYNGNVEPISMEDGFGRVNVYMLPFVKPTHVRRFFGDADISSYTDAVRTAIEAMNINAEERNVLVTHQFVTGASLCESEEISVGGSDNVDASVFDGFDYVALGHIHGAQNCGAERVRYCGTPLKYSFSEAKHQKSLTVVEMSEKGSLFVYTKELTPIHGMSEIRGSFSELTDPAYFEDSAFREDYLHITLTDEEDIPDAVGRLRLIYKNLMRLDYDNRRTRSENSLDADESIETKTAYELFAEFFEIQNGAPMSDGQSEYVRELIEKIEEEMA